MKIEQDIFAIFMPLASLEGTRSILEEMQVLSPGFMDDLPEPIGDLVSNAAPLVQTLADTVRDLQSGDDIDALALIANVLTAARQIYVLIDELSDALDGADPATWPQTLRTSEAWQSLATRLPGYLIFRWVRDFHPRTFVVMDFLNLWKRSGGAFGLDLDQATRFVTEPAPTVTQLFAPDEEVDITAFVGLIQRLVALSGLARPIRPVRYIDKSSVEDFSAEPPRGLMEFSILPEGIATNTALDFFLDLTGQTLDLGMVLGTDETLILPLGEDWRVEAGIDGDTGVGFQFNPTQGVVVDNDAASARASLKLIGEPQEPWRIVGFEKGPQLTLSKVLIEAEAALNANDPSLAVRLGFEGLKLHIGMEESDGFIAEAIPVESLNAVFSAELGWASDSGLNLTSSGPSSFDIPLNLSIGPVSIPAVSVTLTPQDPGIDLKFGLSVGADLGFLQVVVHDVGASVRVRPGDADTSTFGDIALEFGFQPPTGLGLSIGNPKGPIGGGGFLNADHEAGRYDGILDLQVVKVGITAIVIIDTKALDSGAWSMFFALFIEFPSIELVMGLTLDGVGGVAGINRTLEPEALLAAVRSGNIDTVLFPENPIQDAPIIINTFRALFPPAQGRYVFGPVVKLGWLRGMVSAELGVVIELPDPIKVAVLGSIKIVVPKLPEQAQPSVPGDPEGNSEPAIVRLRLDLAGVFDFGAGTVSVDAYLHNSAIAGFPIDGGMSMRAGFKDDRYFLIALGGFHPGFAQPDNFPIVPRLAMGLEIAEVIEISLASYFAFASNTIQFGASIHLSADIAIFAIEGGFEFDALIELNPFHMDVSVNMYVSVQAVGIDLLAVSLVGSLIGPKPWIVNAVAEVNLVGYREGIEINYGTGDALEAEAQAPPGVFEMLVAQIAAPDAWSLQDTGGARGVLLADRDPRDTDPAAAPDAVLILAQQLAPLSTLVDRFGSNLAVAHSMYQLQVSAPAGAQVEDVTDWFAPGQFRNLGNTDQAKLSAPSFERMPAGKKVFGPLQAGPARASSADYKVSHLDPKRDIDPSIFPDPPVVTAEDLLRDEEDISVVLNSEDVGFANVGGVTPVEVLDPIFQSVDVVTGQPGAAGSYMSVTQHMDAGSAAVVRAFEMEPL